MKTLLSFIFMCGVLCMLNFSSCVGSKNISKEHQTQLSSVVDTLLFSEGRNVYIQNKGGEYQSTFYLVRHAEKEKDGSRNPSLTATGKERAQQLANILTKINISNVYATDFNRTQQTANPTAQSKGLSVEKYNPSDANLLANELIQNHKNQNVLIVGHSNSTPTLINALANSDELAKIDESDYGNFYVVQIRSRGDVVVQSFRF